MHQKRSYTMLQVEQVYYLSRAYCPSDFWCMHGNDNWHQAILAQNLSDNSFVNKLSYDRQQHHIQ